MSKLTGLLKRWSEQIENKTNEMRRAHGLPEDHRASEYRKKKYEKRSKKKL